MHSEICPICLGKGEILDSLGSGTGSTKKCHGCGGRGWVEVSDNYQYPYTWPWVQPYEWDIKPYKWESTGTSNNDNVIISFEFSKKKK